MFVRIIKKESTNTKVKSDILTVRYLNINI